MLTPGRRHVAGDQILDLLDKLPDEKVDEELLRLVEWSIEVNDEARRRLVQWRSDRTVNEGSREEARKLDNELDRAIGALHSALQAMKKGFPDEPRGEVAAEILETLFPEGAAGITNLPFEDELSAVRIVVEDLSGKWAEEADELGVRPLVDRVDGLADRFADALGEAETRKTTWDEVRAADNEGQDAMLRVAYAILGRFHGPDERETARKLLEPIIEQDERIGELHSRNRRITDVDPETGEEETQPEGETESTDGSETSDGETDETSDG
jgi:hypothetical protein